MQVPVGRFLTDEASDFGFKASPVGFIHQGQSLLERVDEILLTDHKTHGQCIKKSTAKGISPVPAAIKGLTEINEQAADH